jgi:hypothetical protein
VKPTLIGSWQWYQNFEFIFLRKYIFLGKHISELCILYVCHSVPQFIMDVSILDTHRQIFVKFGAGTVPLSRRHVENVTPFHTQYEAGFHAKCRGNTNTVAIHSNQNCIHEEIKSKSMCQVSDAV